MLNLLIIDSSQTMGQLMKIALRDEPDCQIVGVATGVKEARPALAASNAVMINASLPDTDPLELIRLIAREYPATRILVMDAPDDEDTSQYLEAGAHEVATQDASLNDLLARVRSTAPKSGTARPAGIDASSSYMSSLLGSPPAGPWPRPAMI
jgi:DNA-binding NarL/FixJ family response regulator